MTIDERTQSLIVAGASIAANCRPCLQTSLTRALEYGIDEQELVEAMKLGKKVRQAAALKMDRFTIDLINTPPTTAEILESGCECRSRAASTGGIDG